MNTRYGFSVVNAENILETLKEFGIHPWPKIEGPIIKEDYLKRNLNDRECQDLQYMIKDEVNIFRDPHGFQFVGFRRVARSGTAVFTLLPGNLLPVVAEFQHGAEMITIRQPGGNFNGDESTNDCAKREFEEETGIELDQTISLMPQGLVVSARLSNERLFPFLGIPKKPILSRPQNCESSEIARVFLIPIEEWLKLIDKGEIVDIFAVAITFLALRFLGPQWKLR